MIEGGGVESVTVTRLLCEMEHRFQTRDSRNARPSIRVRIRLRFQNRRLSGVPLNARKIARRIGSHRLAPTSRTGRRLAALITALQILPNGARDATNCSPLMVPSTPIRGRNGWEESPRTSPGLADHILAIPACCTRGSKRLAKIFPGIA